MKKQIFCVMLAVLIGVVPCFAGPREHAIKDKKHAKAVALYRNAAKGNAKKLEKLLLIKEKDGTDFFSKKEYTDALYTASYACKLNAVQVLVNPTYNINFSKEELTEAVGKAIRSKWNKQYYHAPAEEGLERKTYDKTPEQLAKEQQPCDEVIEFLKDKIKNQAQY